MIKFKKRLHVLATTILLGLSSNVYAMPENYTIQHGNTEITMQDEVMNINQSSDVALIDWSQFNIGSKETVNFIQPTASSWTINRIIGTDASNISGNLNANGNIMLINPNGISIGYNANINVNSIIASTNDLTQDQYNQLQINITPLTNNNGNITNNGTINAKDVVVLTAETVKNSTYGTINAKEVAIGSDYKLSLDTTNKINLIYSKNAVANVVQNHGAIQADNYILLTSKAANDLTLIQNNKITQAGKMITNANGEIELIANNQIDIKDKTNIQSSTLNIQANQISINNNAKINVDNTLSISTNNSNLAIVNNINSETTSNNKTSYITSNIISNALTSANVILTANAQNNNVSNVYIMDTINKQGIKTTDLTLNATNSVNIYNDIMAVDGKLNITLNHDGINIFEANINTNGGNFIAHNDTYIGLTSDEAQNALETQTGVDRIISTNGGNIEFGNITLATGGKAYLDAGSGNITSGNITQGNAYIYHNTGNYYGFNNAKQVAEYDAKGDGKFSSTWDTYLATITNSIEDSAVLAVLPHSKTTSDRSSSYESYIGGQASIFTKQDGKYVRTWSWVSGPENGQIFLTQYASSQSYIRNAENVKSGYSNFNIGEPNNDLFEGIQGQIGVGYDYYNSSTLHPSSWDDIASNSRDVYGYVQEVNLPFSELTAVRHSQTVVIEEPKVPTTEPVVIPDIPDTPTVPTTPGTTTIPDTTNTLDTSDTKTTSDTSTIPDTKTNINIDKVETVNTENNSKVENTVNTNQQISPNTVPQKILASNNLPGTGDINSQNKISPQDTMVLGLTEAVLPLYKVNNNNKSTFIGNYKINVTPDKVDVILAKNQKVPKPMSVTDTQYREYNTDLDINNNNVNVTLIYNNQDLNIMINNKVNNIDNNAVLSKSLLTAFNKMGLALDDLNNINIINK